MSDEVCTDSVRAQLQVLEPLGSSTLLTTDVNGQTVKIQTQPSFRADQGDALNLHVPPQACRRYDPETGLLLENSAQISGGGFAVSDQFNGGIFWSLAETFRGYQ